MTPRRIHLLAKRTLGREPTADELRDWLTALACPPQTSCPTEDCVHDDEGDQALTQHRATSSFPPTLADVRKQAVALGNARVEATQKAERERAVELAVPMPDYVRDALAEFTQRMDERARALHAQHREQDTRERAERQRQLDALDQAIEATAEPSSSEAPA